MQKLMTIKEWAQMVHRNAVDHGWWDKKRDIDEIMVLIHSEISEALEAYRNGEPMIHFTKDGKPDGIAVELADACIRVLDYAGFELWNGVNIQGGRLKFIDTLCAGIQAMGDGDAKEQFRKMTLPMLLMDCHGYIVYARESYEHSKREAIINELFEMVLEIQLWLKINYDIMLEDVMMRKHEYNTDRPYRHGGKRL